MCISVIKGMLFVCAHLVRMCCSGWMQTADGSIGEFCWIVEQEQWVIAICEIYASGVRSCGGPISVFGEVTYPRLLSNSLNRRRTPQWLGAIECTQSISKRTIVEFLQLCLLVHEVSDGRWLYNVCLMVLRVLHVAHIVAISREFSVRYIR